MKRIGLYTLFLGLWLLFLLICVVFDNTIQFVAFTTSWLFIPVVADFGFVTLSALLFSSVIIVKYWQAVVNGIGRGWKSFVMTLIYFIGSWVSMVLVICNESRWSVCGWHETVPFIFGSSISTLILTSIILLSSKCREYGSQ